MGYGGYCWEFYRATIGIHSPFPFLGPDTNRAPKEHISKNKDRDIPYKPPYSEAQ